MGSGGTRRVGSGHSGGGTLDPKSTELSAPALKSRKAHSDGCMSFSRKTSTINSVRSMMHTRSVKMVATWETRARNDANWD